MWYNRRRSHRMEQVSNNCGSSYLSALERSDCTVRATMEACGITYDEAHATLKAMGRKDKKGCPLTGMLTHRKVIAGCKVLSEMHFTDWSYGSKHPYGITLKKFVNTYKEGRWIVIRKSHAFAVIDGKIHDSTSNSPNHYVEWAFRVTEQEGEF